MGQMCTYGRVLVGASVKVRVSFLDLTGISSSARPERAQQGVG